MSKLISFILPHAANQSQKREDVSNLHHDTQKKQEPPEALSKYYWGFWQCTYSEDCTEHFCTPKHTSAGLDLPDTEHEEGNAMNYLCLVTSPILSYLPFLS